MSSTIFVILVAVAFFQSATLGAGVYEAFAVVSNWRRPISLAAYRPLAATALFLAFAFGLTACDSSSEPTNAPPTTAGAAPQTSTPDPCTFPKADIGSSLGWASVGEGSSTPGGLSGQRTCGFSRADGSGLMTISVAPMDQAGFDALRDSVKTTPDYRDVPGVGTGAFRNSGALQAFDGKYWVMVYWADGSVPEAEFEAKLKTLTGKVFDWLP